MKKDDEAFAKAVKNMTIARKAITDEEGTKKPVLDTRGFMECPICKIGRLSYAISSYNGHIHACCTTDGCVSWME